VLSRVGLPTTYDGADFETVLDAMRVDKKARGSQLRFVVLEELARPVVLAGPAEEHLRSAYALVTGGAR
jgi:3-dehydroquinate synthase